jgi:hypothetical protein
VSASIRVDVKGDFASGCWGAARMSDFEVFERLQHASRGDGL